jgi:hypothetical protein
MKMTEKILVVAIFIALILKFSLIPGGDLLLLWATTILSCIYYPFGFLFFNQIRLRSIFKKASYQGVTGQKIFFAVVAGLGLSIICIGSLFKLLSLTGSNEMLLIGIMITSVVLVISLVAIFIKKDVNAKFILWRLGVIGIVGLVLLMTAELSIVKAQYRNHPDYIEAYAKYFTDPKNEELRKKKEVEYYKTVMTEEEFKMYEDSRQK